MGSVPLQPNTWNQTLSGTPAGTPPGWNANPFANVGGVIQPTMVSY